MLSVVSFSQAKLDVKKLNFDRNYHPFLCGAHNCVINELNKVSYILWQKDRL